MEKGTDRGLIFEQVKLSVPDSNRFDLSYENKLTCNFGDLIPIMCQECLPGDNYQYVQSQVFARLAPMVAPIYHKVDLFVHTFFVPNRLVWENSKKFFSPGDGMITMAQQSQYTPPVKPYLNVKGLAANYSSYIKSGTLWDYMGLPSIGDTPSDYYPTITAQSITASGEDDLFVDSLPFRAYQLIYNEYYRDQNLTEPIEIPLTDGSEDLSDSAVNLLTIRKRAFEKDYFTSALPNAQRGADVLLPVGGKAPLYYEAPADSITYEGGKYFTPYLGIMTNASDTPQGAMEPVSLIHGDKTTSSITPITAYADLSQATAINIESLREAMMLQSFLEKSARAGARYDETVLAMFGVKPEDSRLQRPEYLGGGRQPIRISDIEQTSATEQGSTELGYLAGKGISSDSSNDFSYFCTEHGWMISILSIRPRTAYAQGLPRKFQRFDMYDYAWPEFAHLGEQPVYNKELYFSGDGYNDEIFGYQSRYADYKYNPDEFHGEFRTNLNFWHLGRQFDSRPGLNTQFVEVSDTNRIFAVIEEDTHHVYLDINNTIIVDRKLPKFGTPHF